jgi:hypothetical protein
MLICNYSIRAVKNTVPKERLLVIKLEDGLGWEQICPFLDMPIPEEKYPRGNEVDKFQGLVEDYFKKRTRAAMRNLGAIIVPVLGLSGYLGWKYFGKLA